jgi:hypothetical protein
MKPKIPRYMRPLLRDLRERQVPAGLHNIIVRHDSWCAHWKGGACDCNPEVELPFPGRN